MPRDMYQPSAQEAIQQHRAGLQHPHVVTNNVENAQGPVTIVNNIGYSSPTWVPPRSGGVGPLSKIFVYSLLTMVGIALLVVSRGWLLIPAGLGLAVYLVTTRIGDRKDRARELARRADAEHQQFMSGDPMGLYGQYEPEV